MNENCIRWAAALMLCATSLGVLAHGDEPHGDEPHPAASPASAGPRFEAATESFEMVGRLDNGALTLFINRFETSEPVLQAKVELESDARTAVATYEAQQGSYVVSDAGFVAALGQPGAHPLVVTVTAGKDADLLEATLNIAPPSTAAPDAQGIAPAVALAGTVGLLLAAALWLARKRRSIAGAQA